MESMPNPLTLSEGSEHVEGELTQCRAMVSRRRCSSNSLAPGIAALATAEGCTETRIPGVVVWRMSAARAPTPTLYGASLILVGSGEKRATFADEILTYDTERALVVTSPLPMLCQSLASVARPVLTLVVPIDFGMLRELLVELPPRRAARTLPPRAVPSRTAFCLPLSDELEAAGARLLRHLASDRRAALLARQTIREMLILVLETPQGQWLRGAAEGQSARLYHVLREMNDNFTQRMPVERLARLAGMSVPTFHASFKAATNNTPLQYMKALRLTRARQMLSEGIIVKTVARDVGYESESQFSREYRRFFGATPSSNSATVRKQ
jgi:AraC-like DNA-binding protein